MDATGLDALERVVRNLRKQGTVVLLSAALGDRKLRPNIHAAMARAREVLAEPPATSSQGALPGVSGP